MIADELAQYLQQHREKRLGPVLPVPEPVWEDDPWHPEPESQEGTSAPENDQLH